MHPIAAYVLCGGESRRFGSDKALARHNGLSLVQGVVGTLQVRYSEVTIVTAPGRQYDINIPVVYDQHPGLGPLAGLHAALNHAGADMVAVAPCDVIGLDARWYEPLERACREHPAAAFFTDRWQPLVAVYRRELLSEIESRLESGLLAVHALLEAYGARVAPPADFASLVRVNRPEDLP